MTKKQALSNSYFYMWRCILAICWADGRFSQEEIDYFEKVLDNLSKHYDLSQEQRETLANELMTSNADNINSLFAHINDVDVRKTLIGFAHDVAWLDGVVSPEEDIILKNLYITVDSEYNYKALRAEIKDFVIEKKEYAEREEDKIRTEIHDRNSLVGSVDSVLQDIGIDILFD